MPEIRLNMVTRDWVIIATERARRPHDFKRSESEPPALPPRRDDCPFCPGLESLSPGETWRVPDESGGWRVRVVPNKYPAVAAAGERTRHQEGMFRTVNGVGWHEVIVETPRHDLTTALLEPAQVAEILRVYRDRYTVIRADPRVEAIVIFKNHGPSAGTSLEHPHSQLAATPVVPYQFRSRVEEAMRHFDDSGRCVFCQMLESELAEGTRLIEASAHFVAFIPYAAFSPFHTWIFPRRHSSSYEDITDVEIADLAALLRRTLRRIYFGLGNPDFNYSIRCAPTRLCPVQYFHWYLTIIPRVSKMAGFEIGSGMFINPSLPEKSAEFLRGVDPS